MLSFGQNSHGLEQVTGRCGVVRGAKLSVDLHLESLLKCYLSRDLALALLYLNSISGRTAAKTLYGEEATPRSGYFFMY